MFNWIDRFPLKPLFFVAVIFAILPLHPEPHLFEKLRMLAHGALVLPIDIFDLFLHSLGLILLAIRLVRIRLYGKT